MTQQQRPERRLCTIFFRMAPMLVMCCCPPYPYIWRSSSKSAISVVRVVGGIRTRRSAHMLREDSSLVGPCEETRAGAERQAHPGADEVVDGRLDCGAIKRSGLQTPDQQPRCPTDLQAFPVTNSAGRGLVDNRYAAVNAYPSEHCRFALTSGRTWNPTIIASDALASDTSLSVIAPAPL